MRIVKDAQLSMVAAHARASATSRPMSNAQRPEPQAQRPEPVVATARNISRASRHLSPNARSIRLRLKEHLMSKALFRGLVALMLTCAVIGLRADDRDDHRGPLIVTATNDGSANALRVYDAGTQTLIQTI